MPSTWYFVTISRCTWSMNSKLYGPERARDPQIRVRPVPVAAGRRAARRSSPDAPLGHPRRAACGSVRAMTCIPSARQPATSVPNGSVSREPGAAVVQRHLRRVVGDDPAGAQAWRHPRAGAGSSRARTAGRSGRDRSRPASAGPTASARRTIPAAATAPSRTAQHRDPANRRASQTHRPPWSPGGSRDARMRTAWRGSMPYYAVPLAASRFPLPASSFQFGRDGDAEVSGMVRGRRGSGLGEATLTTRAC